MNDPEIRAKIDEARRRAAARKLERQQKEQAGEEASQTGSPDVQSSETTPPDADEPVKPAAPKTEAERFSLSKEIQYIKEFAAKYSGPRRERKRLAEDVKATKQRWEAGELLKRKKAPETPTTPQPEEVDLSEMTKEERDAYEARVQQEQEELDRINATPLMHVGDDTTVWEQRLVAAKERLRRTWPASTWRKLRRKAAVSDNPALQQARDMKDDMADNISDIKEFYGTTQHPVISRLRDGVDNVTGETETGWAIGQIRRVDPGFEIQLFLEDMEDYMIPLVVEAYLKADMVVMSAVMEEKAQGWAFATCREREVLGLYWDDRILNTDHVDFQGATVENDIPYITLSFVCQHVHCVKDKKGVIVEGHAAEVKSVYYAWKMRRDFDNPDFDWKIVDMHCQRIFSLVG